MVTASCGLTCRWHSFKPNRPLEHLFEQISAGTRGPDLQFWVAAGLERDRHRFAERHVQALDDREMAAVEPVRDAEQGAQHLQDPLVPCWQRPERSVLILRQS